MRDYSWQHPRGSYIQERWFDLGNVGYTNFYGQYSEYHGSYTWQKLVNAVGQCGLEMAASAHRGLADARASLAVLKYVAAMSNGG